MIYDYMLNYCEKKKTTVTQFERDCGLGRGTIGKWKDSKPSLETLKKVSDYTKINFITLVKEAMKEE